MGLCASKPDDTSPSVVSEKITTNNEVKQDASFEDELVDEEPKSEEQDAANDFATEIAPMEEVNRRDPQSTDVPHVAEETERIPSEEFTHRPQTLDFELSTGSPAQSTDSVSGSKKGGGRRPSTKKAVSKVRTDTTPKPISPPKPTKVKAAVVKKAKEKKAEEEARIRERRASVKSSSKRRLSTKPQRDDEDSVLDPEQEPQSVMDLPKPTNQRSPGTRLYEQALKLREKQMNRRKSVEIEARRASNAYKSKSNRAPLVRRSLTDLSTQQMSDLEKRLLEQFRNVDFFSLECVKYKNRVVVPLKSNRWLVKCVKPETERQLRSAVFQSVEGLVGNVEGSISLACVNYPEAYLRHEDARIRLRRLPEEEPLNWRKDATWRVKEALDGSPLHVSFESVSKPDWFIHVDNFALVLKKKTNASDTDASFRLIPSVIDMGDEWEDEDDDENY